MSASVVSVISRFLEEYLSSTPQRLKLLDAYLLYILLTGALQFGYCLLVGTFPFNSFLSGFISCVGSFILAGIIAAYLQLYPASDFFPMMMDDVSLSYQMRGGTSLLLLTLGLIFCSHPSILHH